MSWASRRRTQYAAGVALFLFIVIGGPVIFYIASKPPTCFDGARNQGETAVDKGGPCLVVDENALSPVGVVWARSFRVREGSYNAVALIQNPNPGVGSRSVSYRFSLYDERNLLITEHDGSAVLMPGKVTPVFEGAVETGNRVVAHTIFDILETPTWERLEDTSLSLAISNVNLTGAGQEPRVTAEVRNESVSPVGEIVFTALVFDPAGNAFAASQTALTELQAGARAELIFTWPTPFRVPVGRVQVLPRTEPRPVRGF